MPSKRSKIIFFTGLAGFLVMIIFAVAWHLFIKSDFEKFHTGVTFNTIYFVGCFIAGYLIMSFLMVALYAMSTKNRSPSLKGLFIGVLAGICSIVLLDLVNLPFFQYASFENYCVDICWHALEQGFGGLVIANIYSKQKHKLYRQPALFEYYRY